MPFEKGHKKLGKKKRNSQQINHTNKRVVKQRSTRGNRACSRVF